MDDTSPLLTYREYQEAVAEILNYYGFIARIEFWSAAGRLDVFVVCSENPNEYYEGLLNKKLE